MHRLADDNEDNAPFQIDYLDLGVQAKQLQRVLAAYQCPLLTGETLSSGFLTQTEERVPVYRLILTFKNINILKLLTVLVHL